MNTGQASIYPHQEIEDRWQTEWNKLDLYLTDTKTPSKPFYNLMMFPYPSAEGLHVGNMYAFTGSDVYGRFKRMAGYTVFEPIGLDGFGIHSENYSIKIGRHPMEHAKITESNFYAQLHKIGAMFDWTKTVETYKPTYYQYTQWLFVQLFKHGLVYRGKAEVNWCPSCKTVLADEQVIDGKCERCGNKVIKRLLEQWFFKITAYAEKLHANIPALQWSEKVKIAQKNWIGKKEGLQIDYDIVQSEGKKVGLISCFTTRPDTNFGATFVAIAPNHPFITQLSGLITSEKLDAISLYAESVKNPNNEEGNRKKTGVFTGLYAVNNLNNTKMPLYVSDFVLGEFGTGAVVGVPGHDARDFEFAQTFDIPIIRVVVPPTGETGNIKSLDDVFENDGTMIHSEFLDGLDIHQAKQKITEHIISKGWGRLVTTYHLRDWLVSRQRYWGPPIPMIFCQHCAEEGKSYFTTEEAKSNKMLSKDIENGVNDMKGWYPVDEKTLPVELPFIEDFKPGDDGVPPLQKHKEFYETKCPGCGKGAVRETEVSDTFLDSSWYFLRYPSVEPPTEESAKLSVPQLANSSGLEMRTENFSDSSQPSAQNSQLIPWNPDITKKWLPVSMYSGGAEHSVLHLMYSRFVTMALHDLGYLDFEEPFANFFAHGLVIKDGAKMSKSKGNVVNPDEYIKSYGSDALRLYLMFIGPYSDGGDFRDSAMEGMFRWVGRIWRIAQVVSSKQPIATSNGKITKSLHRLIKKVGEDIERRHYNTAIASMMEFTNLVSDEKNEISVPDLQSFLKLLAPFAPHVAEELFQQLQHSTALTKKEDSIHLQSWPTYDTSQLTEDMMQIVIQVNGKVRDSISLSAAEASDQSKVDTLSRARENVKKHLESREVKKVIFVPNKVINFVLNG